MNKREFNIAMHKQNTFNCYKINKLLKLLGDTKKHYDLKNSELITLYLKEESLKSTRQSTIYPKKEDQLTELYQVEASIGYLKDELVFIETTIEDYNQQIEKLKITVAI